MMDEVEKLIQQLKEPDAGPEWVAWTKRNAADKLGNIGDARATGALTEALKDEVSAVRESAVRALFKIKDPRSVPGLIDALKGGDSYLRAEAACALGQIGGAGAVSALIDALKDGDSTVRNTAAFALGNIAEKTEINLDKVKQLLHGFVDGAEPEVRGMAKREASANYAKIAAGVAKRKLAEMGGEMLKEKPKPPKGKGRVYREMRRTTA